MKNRIVMALMAAFAFTGASAQIDIPYTEIGYDVNYHWGIIDVMIARGTVTVECNNGEFRGTLDGTSIPWEGHIICVSDTLNAYMEGSGAGIRETVQYQNGWYRRPPVSYFRSGGYNPENPANYRNITGQGAYDASDDTMEAITITSDMIGMYYYARVIDFAAMRPGERIVVPIQGPFSREVVITYQGQSVYSRYGDNYPVYDCTFEYGYGGRLSGFPVECKIGASSRLPLYFGASLPVGTVELLYNP